MRQIRTIAILIAGLLLATPDSGLVSAAAPIRMIAHPSFPLNEMTAEELKSIYLMKKTQVGNGSRVEPVLHREGSLHEQFAEQFLGRTALALESFYRSRVFSGAGLAPRSFANEGALVQYVLKTPGAIGYVGGAMTPAGVKVIVVKQGPL